MLKTLNNQNLKKEINTSDGLLIIEVGATWCGSCHIMEPVLKEINREYHNDLTIGRIDIAYAEELAEKYGINDLPTYLFFKNGKLVDHLVGSLSRANFSQKIKSLIR